MPLLCPGRPPALGRNPLHPTTYLTDTGPGLGQRRTARSWLSTDAPTLSLDGDWRFRLLPGAPGTPGAAGVLPEGEGIEAVAEPDFDDSGWDTLPVPAHWVLQGDGRYGLPIYTNVQMPFPLEPPFVPDANPTGDYRRTFSLPGSWSDAEAVALRFDGVESRYKVWVNGSAVGVGSGSRLAQEFDVTDLVRPGENLIVVRVHQWSAASYVEDQDQWWLPGIFRSVSLQARPAGGIEDVWLRAGYDDGAGTLEAELRGASFPLTLTIEELDLSVTWDSADEVQPLRLPSVEPWSAEVPRLYDVTVANAAESIALRIGFRTVEIRGDLFLVNGHRVVFHGMNRHETHPDRGRVFDEEFARADLAMMKRFNVNAIRTSHYPPHPRLLDLADELGFWVILECDLETHAFENSGGAHEEWRDNPSDDPRWRDAYLDRIERTVERDKNHPSIVMWSLGNESGRGANLAAMAAWVHARDPERPVHYEGDYTGAYTDVYSRMYSSIAETRSIGRDDDRAALQGCTAAESARQRTKPFLLCEYVHAMGNGPGAIDQYEELVREYPRLHGGFVWEWRDHGLRTRTADGTEFFAYGGDFGEVVHDGNFVMDGMVLSDDTPTPGLHEWKHVVAPVGITFDACGTDKTDGIVVENRRHSADLGDLELRWSVSHDGHPADGGVLDLGEPLAAGSTTRVTRPGRPADDGAETWLTVEAVLATDTVWAKAGHVVAAAQLELSRPATVPAWARSGGSATQTSPGTGHASFEDGLLSVLAGLPVSGPRAELWRAPTDNDKGSGFGSYDLADPWADLGRGIAAPSSRDVWTDAGLQRLTARTEAVDDGGRHRRLRYAAADSKQALLAEERWTTNGGAEVLRVDLVPTEGWRIHWPRLGVRFTLPGSVNRAAWFGAGERESYPDSSRSALVGRFDSHVHDLTVDYARPQESGHRSGLRELVLFEGGSPWLRIEAAPDLLGRRPGFTLRRHTTEQVTAAGHPHELPASDHVYLWIDAAQNGLGSRACGPDVWPDHILRPEARTITLRFTPLR
ncbi:glycoside hydrolase family 2 TIM barrel-domain containing protein [Antribacter soli]|uniref:glycoside hydrolase family 2 TIM barrel-domain containing protein n=1 Tax=Antribacter soli TaxID=2910976 RepID=UPI0035563127